MFVKVSLCDIPLLGTFLLAGHNWDSTQLLRFFRCSRQFCLSTVGRVDVLSFNLRVLFGRGWKMSEGVLIYVSDLLDQNIWESELMEQSAVCFYLYIIFHAVQYKGMGWFQSIFSIKLYISVISCFENMLIVHMNTIKMRYGRWYR